MQPPLAVDAPMGSVIGTPVTVPIVLPRASVSVPVRFPAYPVCCVTLVVQRAFG